jgi:hypothetical protein
VVTFRSPSHGYGGLVEEARRVIERLDRIETMQRAHAGPAELLDELRALLDDAQAWARTEGGDAGEAAVERLHRSLARDMIEV